MSFFIELEQDNQTFESALQECFETIFDKDHSPEENAADFFVALLQSHKKYVQEQERLERIKANSSKLATKEQSKGKGKGKKTSANFGKAQNSYTQETSASNAPTINYVSAGADAHVPGALSVRLASENEVNQGYRPIDELSNKNSIFCDYYTVLEQLFTIHNKGSISSLYQQLLDQDEFINLCITLGIYSTLTTSALNRTIIHCHSKNIDDDILTNSCDVFTKLPQWGLTFDFSECPVPFGKQNITGLIITRQTVFTRKGNTTAAPSKVESEPDIFYNNLCLMICCDNKKIFTTDVELLLDSENSVASLIEQIKQGALEYIEGTIENAKAKIDRSVKNSEDILSPIEELSDDFYMMQLSKDEYINSIKQAMKQVVYFLTHQSELKDDKGQNVVLENTSFNSLKGNDFYQLKNKVPFNHCTF